MKKPIPKYIKIIALAGLVGFVLFAANDWHQPGALWLSSTTVYLIAFVALSALLSFVLAFGVAMWKVAIPPYAKFTGAKLVLVRIARFLLISAGLVLLGASVYLLNTIFASGLTILATFVMLFVVLHFYGVFRLRYFPRKPDPNWTITLKMLLVKFGDTSLYDNPLYWPWIESGQHPIHLILANPRAIARTFLINLTGSNRRYYESAGADDQGDYVVLCDISVLSKKQQRDLKYQSEEGGHFSVFFESADFAFLDLLFQSTITESEIVDFWANDREHEEQAKRVVELAAAGHFLLGLSHDGIPMGIFGPDELLHQIQERQRSISRDVRARLLAGEYQKRKKARA